MILYWMRKTLKKKVEIMMVKNLLKNFPNNYLIGGKKINKSEITIKSIYSILLNIFLGNKRAYSNNSNRKYGYL